MSPNDAFRVTQQPTGGKMNELFAIGVIEVGLGLLGVVFLDDAYLKLSAIIAFIGVFTLYYAGCKAKSV